MPFMLSHLLALCNSRRPYSAADYVVGESGCNVCGSMAYLSKSLLAKHMPIDDIKKQLYSTCSILSGNDKAVCHLIYSDKAAAILDPSLDELESCQRAGFCLGKEKTGSSHAVNHAIKLARSQKITNMPLDTMQTPDCSICQMVYMFLTDSLGFLNAPNTYSDWIKMCQSTPSIADRCQIFTYESVSRLTQYFFDHMDKYEVCTFFGVC